MIVNIKKFFQMCLLVLGTSMAFAAAPPVAPAAAACSTNDAIMVTIPTWYNGLDVAKDGSDNCVITDFKLNDVWVIVLNGIEILLQVAAYVSVAYVIWGGFKYIKSEGDSGKINESKNAILNAIIGLVIALGSVAVVSYIQGSIL